MSFPEDRSGGLVWIRAFFQAVYRTIRVSLERAKRDEEENFQRIQLTERENALYFRFPRPKVQLGYGVGDSAGRVDLSLADARTLIAAIESACKRRDVVSVALRDFSATIDARSKPRDPDRIIVRFSAPMGSANTTFSRERLLSGCNEFFDTFGKVPSAATSESTDH